MLVVPDVHGREFWRKPLEDYPEEEVIFLGDYLDPYPEEGITPEDSLTVFQDILQLPILYPERKITYLLGNHDLMYLNNIHRRSACRHDWENEKKIQDLYRSIGLETWDVVAVRENFIFSHAGLHSSWIERHTELGKDIWEVIETLKTKLWSPEVMEALSEISGFRGGWDIIIGSPVWSDVREWINWESSETQGYIQIFGHTQLKDGVIIDIREDWKCIDCKHVIRITENSKLEIL